MTNWENHRTQDSYENALVFKIFIFQFVNTYASIFYIAFFKGKFIGYPGNYETIFGRRLNPCPPYGCMTDLTIQLAVIFIGRQLFFHFIDLIWPKLVDWCHERKLTSAATQWERDAVLEQYPGLMYEYLNLGAWARCAAHAAQRGPRLRTRCERY